MSSSKENISLIYYYKSIDLLPTINDRFQWWTKGEGEILDRQDHDYATAAIGYEKLKRTCSQNWVLNRNVSIIL